MSFRSFVKAFYNVHAHINFHVHLHVHVLVHVFPCLCLSMSKSIHMFMLHGHEQGHVAWTCCMDTDIGTGVHRHGIEHGHGHGHRQRHVPVSDNCECSQGHVMNACWSLYPVVVISQPKKRITINTTVSRY